MRTIEEIKETICADFMRNESVAELFGFTPGDSFTSHFSKVSVIGILFYIFAVAAWALEKLFDTYKGEVDTRIEEIIPHRPRWYRDKVLAFMKGKTLIADTDRYDTEGMTEDAIAAARVVKHAVAVENRDASLLTIESACREAVRNYIENLPFNGEYTNMALVDALQTLDGVRIVEFRGATTVAAGEEVLVTIDARCIPAAGYFEMGDVVLNMKAYNG